jgi:hypothetical protein
VIRRPSLNDLLDDAHRFVIEHAEVIMTSALHIYDSALHFTPHNTVLFKNFQHEFVTTVRVLSGSKMVWESPSNAMEYYLPKRALSPVGAYLSSFRKGLAMAGPRGTAARMHKVIDIRSTLPILGVAVCPDGTRFVTRSNESMCLRDTSTGNKVATFNFQSLIKFSANSQRIALQPADSVQIRNLITGKHISTFTCPRIAFIEFSPDGARIVTFGTYHLFLRDTRNGGVIASVRYGTMRDVKFSPDSTRLVFMSFRGMELWDAATGQSLAVLGDWSSINFSPDSSRLQYHSSDGLRLWDSASGAPINVENLEHVSTETSSVKYALRDNWVVGSLEGQLKWICWLPLAVRGENPIASFGGKCFVVANDRGEWTVFDFSSVRHWDR